MAHLVNLSSNPFKSINSFAATKLDFKVIFIAQNKEKQLLRWLKGCIHW